MWYVAILLILVVALTFRLGLLAYAMYVVLGVLLVSRYLARNWADSLTAEREISRLQVEVGERVAVNIQLQNRSNWLIPWVLWEDLLPREAVMYDPPSLAVEGRRVQLVMVGPRQTKRLNYSFVCNRRGYYQIGPLAVETGDLFGLHRKYLALTEPQFLLVLPRIVPLEGYHIASRRPIGEVQMSYRLFEDPTRIAGVRAYEAGDPLNRVHWRATARTGTLHSKVYEPSTVSGATIVLDFHQSSFATQHEPYRSELAVTATASIANALYLMGQQVGLITNGRDAADRMRREGIATDARSRSQVRKSVQWNEQSDRLQPILLPTNRGPESATHILQALARLERTDGLTFPQLIQETTSRLPRDATVIAILTHVSAEHTITLDMLRRQGYSVVAILNIYDEYEYSQAAGPLLAVGIETRYLRNEEAISDICGKQRGVAFA